MPTITLPVLLEGRHYVRTESSQENKSLYVFSDEKKKEMELSKGIAFPVRSWFLTKDLLLLRSSNRIDLFRLVDGQPEPMVTFSDVIEVAGDTEGLFLQHLGYSITKFNPLLRTEEKVANLKDLGVENISDRNVDSSVGNLNDLCLFPDLGFFLYQKNGGEGIQVKFINSNQHQKVDISKLKGFQLISKGYEGNSVFVKDSQGTIAKFTLPDLVMETFPKIPGKIISLTPLGKGVYLAETDMGKRTFPYAYIESEFLLVVDGVVNKMDSFPWKIEGSSILFF